MFQEDEAAISSSSMAAGQHLPVADLTQSEREQLRGLRKRKKELIDEIERIKDELQTVEGDLESLYYVDESSAERKQMMIAGRKKFNTDSEAGLAYLIERGLVERTPESVAAFLYKGEGLSKSAVGDYLGSNDVFNLEVLDRFIKYHDFSNLTLVDALRIFMFSFRLPGESQKIDRIMEKFAAHFCTMNDGSFDNAETAYFVSYSCIMLNTLLHNPAVKDRPSLERYVNMNKECVEKNGVSLATLSAIYDSIQRQPFKLPDDDSNRLSEIFLEPKREGWLYKQGNNQSFVGPLSWKRRWFILSDGCLYYFATSVDRTPKGIIPLKNVGVQRVQASTRPHMFEIYSLSPEEKIKACKTEQSGGRVVEGKHSNYRMCASSQEDLRQWIEAIAASVQTTTGSSLLARPKSVH